jgi:hypothetical protein
MDNAELPRRRIVVSMIPVLALSWHVRPGARSGFDPDQQADDYYGKIANLMCKCRDYQPQSFEQVQLIASVSAYYINPVLH